jgi:D-alanyl-D-alanine carboxypeptidase
MGSLDVSFEKTSAFAWLQENAAQFGFILRYPKEKEDITGYTYEPWHYRFVGRAAALEIKAADLTLEEYLGQLGN